MKKDLIVKNTEKIIDGKVAQNNSGPVKGEILKGFLLLSMLLVGLIIPYELSAQRLTGQSTAPAIKNNIAASSDTRTSYADVVEKVTPAVVTVRSAIKTKANSEGSPLADDEALRQFFGKELPQMSQTPKVEHAIGSGVIVQPNGIILTNNHVVNDATQVKVDLPDKRTFDAKVIGTDPASDLAVLKIEATNLPTLALGDSDRVRVGDVVLAIGNPLGLRQTVTSGIISAKGRQTGLSDGSFEDFLQTDAPINQGNSGGALVNLNGELVGINSQILSPSGGSIGLGFSIPSNMAKSVMGQLLKDGKVHRGMLGVGIQDVNSDLAENFGLKEVRGVIVNSVTPNSPAEKAGLKQGDVILSLNGVNVDDGNTLRNHVAQTAPNTEATLGIMRNGNEQTVKIMLGEFQPKKAVSGEKDNSGTEPTPGKLGLSLKPVTPQIAQQLELGDVQSGLVVMSVQPGSPADDAGIGQGDLIMQVNRQAVKTAEDIKSAMDKAKGNSVLFLINRGGQTVFVTVRM
jgi:serine protease Do